MQQQTFWPGIESKYAEEQALLIGAVERLGKRKHIAAELVELLRYLSNCDPSGEGARTYLSTMVDRTGIAQRTLQTRLRVLREAGYLAWWRTPQGRMVNRVDWEAIKRAAFAGEPGAGRREPVVGGQESGVSGREDVASESCATPRKTGAGSRNSCATPRRSGATNIKASCSVSLKELPQQQQRDGWSSLAATLSSLGLFTAGSTLTACRAAGVSHSEAEAIVEHWQANAAWWRHDLRVLVLRLREAFPGQAVESGWPPRTDPPPESDPDEPGGSSDSARAARIIKEGRRRGHDDEYITRVLDHYGLSWP